jgi:hypothetical protein
MDQPQQREIRATYRALLARGLEPAEAANLTAFLHGLPSGDLHWSVREVEALVVKRQAWTETASTDDALEAVSGLGGSTSAPTT